MHSTKTYNVHYTKTYNGTKWVTKAVIPGEPNMPVNWVTTYKDMAGAKEMTGTTHDVDIAVDKELARRAKEKKVTEKLDLVAAFGEDTFEDKTVVRFDKQFNANEKTYSYAAIKTGGYWYTTGGKCLTWEQFLGFLVAGEYPVTEFTLMVPYVAG
jgi:hypothetical protein